MKYIKFTPTEKFYFKNGLLHREDGPAVIKYLLNLKYESWFFEGKRHRLNGPAVCYYGRVPVWYFYGKKIDCNSTEEFQRKIKLLAFL